MKLDLDLTDEQSEALARCLSDAVNVIYTAQEGEEIRLCDTGLVVFHPDRPPKLVRWDGTIEEIPADHEVGPLTEEGQAKP